MSPLVACALVVALHVLLGWLVPGAFCELRLRRWLGPPRGFAEWIERSLALGSLVLVAQIVLQVAALRAGATHAACVVAVGALDLLLLGVLLLRDRRELWAAARPARSMLGSPLVWLLVAGGAGAGALGAWYVPYALDNAALQWTTSLLGGRSQDLGTSQGSPAYIGLLYQPAWLLRDVAPVPLVGAMLKVPLGLLVALVCWRWTVRLGLRWPAAAAVLMLLWVLDSMFGVYGVLETGKETPFGILWLLLAAATLPARHDGRPTFAPLGMRLAAAVGFGAITVPYGAVLIGIWLLLEAGRLRPFAVLGVLLAWCALPLWVSLDALVGALGPGEAAACLAAGGVLCAALWRWRPPVAPLSQRPRYPLAVTLLLVALVAAVELALPVRWVVPHSPLDGQTSLLDMLRWRQQGLVWAGAGGLLLALLHPRLRRDPGVHALALFPAAALLPTLALAHLPGFVPPFHPQHLWDLAKDIPNWVFGLYFALFAVLLIDGLLSLACELAPRLDPLLPAACLLSLVYVSPPNSASAQLWDRTLERTPLGGHRDPLFAALIEQLWSMRERPAGLWVSAAYGERLSLPGLEMYGALPTLRLGDDPSAWPPRLPERLVAPRAWAQQLAADGQVRLEELARLPDDSALYRVERVSGPGGKPR